MKDVKDEEIIDVDVKEPFTAKNPITGLKAWGPADSDKEIVNEERDEHGYKVVTVEFPDGTRNMVRLLGDRVE